MSDPRVRSAARSPGGQPGAPASSDHGDETETLAGAEDLARPGPPRADAPPPRILGKRYLLEERIASGGMASVWRAHDEVLARTVAVKLLHDHLAADADFRERFRREAIAAARLSHPNVVGLYDTGTDGDHVYLVMEFVDGVTLKHVIADHGTLEPGQAAAVGEKVARALDYAHERGLVHRDVKPANILIGDDGTVKVADFGIAKAEEADDLTKTGMVLGTAAYVAPEQILAEPLSGAADQYALGCVLYEALTGHQPFRGDSAVATAAQRLEHDPLPVRTQRVGVPRGLDDVVLRALQRDPHDRYPSAGRLADALALFADLDAEQTAALASIREPAYRPSDAWSPGPPAPRPSRGRGRPAREREDSFVRSEGRWLAPVVMLLGLAATLVTVAVATGAIDAEDIPVLNARLRQRAAAAETAAVPPARLSAAAFDPLGDGEENGEELPALFDGDDATAWETEGYNSPALGGLKEGVGFVVDLGDERAVTGVELTTTTPGIAYDIRTAAEPVPAPDAWTTVASVDAADQTAEISLDEPVSTRYLLVWVTGQLQPSGARHRAGFSSMTVTAEAG